MNYRRVVSFYGSVTALAGLLLMVSGPAFLKYFGIPMDAGFQNASLIRFAGVGLFMAGALLLAVAPLGSTYIQRRVTTALAIAQFLGAAIIWAQQTAIWETTAGWCLTAWFAIGGLALLQLNILHAKRSGQSPV